MKKIEILNELLENGTISQEQFDTEKEKLLDAQESNLLGLKENNYCMLLHFSQLLGLVNPVLGIIAPLFLWFLNKDTSSNVNNNGKIVFNWIISMYIYALVIGLIIYFTAFSSDSMVGFNMLMHPFSFISIFIPLFILILINIIFIIIGSLKSKSGILWNYPLSIRFFKLS